MKPRRPLSPSCHPQGPPGKESVEESGAAAGERIAKRLARAGLCSRREAERWIAEGRIAVDGRVLDSPAVLVVPTSRITVDGRLVPPPERTRLWRHHKPRGLVTTRHDPQGRPTIFEALPEALPRVISVGRLDLNSEGLLLLTNDGELARRLEHPKTGWARRYRVRVHGHPEPERLVALKRGITVGNERYGPIQATLVRQQGENAWLTVSLREGRNREVRRVFEHLGFPASRLIRIAYGPFQLGHLPQGAIAEVPPKALAEQLGEVTPGTKPGAKLGAQNGQGSSRGRIGMRIVAGKHRARRLEAPPGAHTRPTAARAREAIFDRLVHGGFGKGGVSLVVGARVLDAFAGSGANGLEALSRGAAHVTFLEADSGAGAAIRANIASLGEAERTRLLSTNATRPPPALLPCALAFLDPPYGSGLAPAALDALVRAGWIEDGAMLVVEVAADEAFEPPAGFTRLDARTYGAAKIVFLRRKAEE